MARKTNKTDHLLNLLAGGGQEDARQAAGQEGEAAVQEAGAQEKTDAGALKDDVQQPEKAGIRNTGQNVQPEVVSGAKNVHVVRAVGSEDPVAELIREELEKDLEQSLEREEQKPESIASAPVDSEQMEKQRREVEEEKRRVAEEAQRVESERKAAEEAKQRAEKETQRLESERKAAEEAQRKAAEEADRVETERKAAEEAQRKAAEEAQRVETERRAAEEAQRKAAEEADRVETERKAAEEAQRRAAEEADRAEEERKAAEEAQKRAAEDAAQAEADRKAAEEAERKAAEADERMIREEDGMRGHVFFNMMEKIVRDKAPEYMEKFGVCNCTRCTADTIALALSKLPPKYVVVEETAVSPLLSFYEDHYAGQIIVEITKACIAVNGNPRHKRETE